MEEIIDLCKKIKSCGTKCKSCGGTIKNCSCSYCGKKSEELEQLVAKLREKLDILKNDNDLNYVPICQLFNYLYSLKDFNIPEVDEILEKANYGSKLEHELEKIVAKENSSQNISASEYELVNFLLINDNLKNYRINWCNFLIKALADKKFHIEYEDLEKLFIIYSEELMKDACHLKKAKCVIGDFEKEEQRGESFFNTIKIDRKLLNNLYQDFSADHLYKIMSTIFHEVTHVNQYSRRIKGNISFYDSLLIKDFILSATLNHYYDDNYTLSSEETEAFLEGDRVALEYLEFLKLQISDQLRKEIHSRTEFFNKVMLNMNRKYQSKWMDINEIFESLHLNKEYLKKYPILKLEYTFNGDFIRRKTLEEVEEDYHNYLNGTLNLNGKKEEIEYYFDSLKNTLDSSKRKEI